MYVCIYMNIICVCIYPLELNFLLSSWDKGLDINTMNGNVQY